MSSTAMPTVFLNKYSGSPQHVTSPDARVRIQTFKNRTIFTVTHDAADAVAKLGSAKLNGITFPFKFAKDNVFTSEYGIVHMCKKRECTYISMNNHSNVLSQEAVDEILKQNKIPEIISSLSDFVSQCDSPESRVVDPVSSSVVFAITHPNQTIRPFVLTLQGTVFDVGQGWDADTEIKAMEDGPAKEDAKYIHSLIPSIFWGCSQVYMQCKAGVSIINVLAKTFMVRQMEFNKHAKTFITQLSDKKLNPQVVGFLSSYLNTALSDEAISKSTGVPLQLNVHNSIRHSTNKRTIENVASPSSQPSQGKKPMRRVAAPIPAAVPCKTLVSNLSLRQVIEDWEDACAMHLTKADVEVEPEPLALGSSKTVFQGKLRVRGQDGKKASVAVLQLRQGESAMEASIFLKLGRHPQLVRFMGQYTHEGQNFLITEFAEKGSLSAAFEEIEETITLPHQLLMMQQIAEGMEFLTSKGVIHRGLAARNVLLFAYDEREVERTKVKVSGYGLAVSSSDRSHVIVGSENLPRRYMPPEALQKGRFSESSDVWSFAVTMWEVLTSGSIPYYDLSDDRAVLEHVLQGGRLPRHVIAGECPDSLWALVMRCWASSAKDRPSFSELVAALRRIREQRNKRKQAELQCEVED